MRFKHLYKFNKPVALLGGGDCSDDFLRDMVQLDYPLIAADGGANHLDNLSILPELIIGDLDSLREKPHWQSRTRVVHLEEQDTTDFEKCLYTVDAPLYVALGFIGKRLDHTLAALHVVAKYSMYKKVVLVGEDDVVFVCREIQSLGLREGTRFSIFPLEPVRFLRSQGLSYPLDDLQLSPTTMIGTSNEVSGVGVCIESEPGWRGAYAVLLPLGAFADVMRYMAT